MYQDYYSIILTAFGGDIHTKARLHDLLADYNLLEPSCISIFEHGFHFENIAWDDSQFAEALRVSTLLQGMDPSFQDKLKIKYGSPEKIINSSQKVESAIS